MREMGHRAIKCGRFSTAAIEEVLVKEVIDETNYSPRAV